MLIREFFLALAVSFDSFLFAVSCGGSGVKIPPLPSVVISLVCSAVLSLSLCLSSIIGEFIPSELCRRAGCAVIAVTGAWSVFRSVLRAVVRKLSKDGSISLKMEKIGLVIKLCLDDASADTDSSKTISVCESLALALAGSLDSLATGLSFGFSGVSPLRTGFFTFICGLAAVFAGSLAGHRISSQKHDFSWIAGVLLIILAFCV